MASFIFSELRVFRSLVPSAITTIFLRLLDSNCFFIISNPDGLFSSVLLKCLLSCAIISAFGSSLSSCVLDLFVILSPIIVISDPSLPPPDFVLYLLI